MDILTSCFLGSVLLLLIAVSVGIVVLRKYVDYGVDPAILDTFRTRVRAWWILFGSLACVFLFGPLATTLLFFIMSIGVLREYITLTPKSPVDHQTLFGIYVFFTPLQFVLVGINPAWFESLTGLAPYRFFSVLLPGYVFLVLPGFMAISGDPKRFLERTAKLQLGLIICVYSLSYAPALLTMDLPFVSMTEETATSPLLNHGLEHTVIESLTPPPSFDAARSNETVIPRFYDHEFSDSSTAPTTDEEAPHGGPVGIQNSEVLKDKTIAITELSTTEPARTEGNGILIRPGILPMMSGKHFRLLFFFVIIVQFGDVFQYLWSQISRRHVVAPKINATKTWEGVFGGAVTTALLGVALWYFTPFTKWWQPGLIALVTSFMGFCGNMTMSAIKRDRGVSGYGTLIQGHSGILDRIDSLCFAAPVFYHLAWLFSR